MIRKNTEQAKRRLLRLGLAELKCSSALAEGFAERRWLAADRPWQNPILSAAPKHTISPIVDCKERAKRLVNVPLEMPSFPHRLDRDVVPNGSFFRKSAGQARAY